MSLFATLQTYLDQHNGFTLLSALALAALFLVTVLGRKRTPANLPPSPPRLPLIGNLHLVGSMPHQNLFNLAQKYGPLMRIYFGRVPAIIVSSGEMAREVMKTYDHIFASRAGDLSMAKKLMYDLHDIAFAPYGQYWRQVRKVSALHLLSLKRVQSFRPVREEEAARMLKRIRASATAGEEVNLSEMMITFTNNLICRVALGGKFFGEDGGSEQFREMLAELGDLLVSFPYSEFIPLLGWIDNFNGVNRRVKKNIHDLDNFLGRVLDERLEARRNSKCDQGKELTNFLDVLLSLDGKDPTVGITLTNDNIKAIILDMFAAGTETTFTALEWTMAELFKHPEIARRLQEEVRGVVGSKGEVVEEDLERMPYLKAVIKESMRLHPPVGLFIPRETLDDVEVNGYFIPRGTRVMMNAWAISRDPKAWDRPDVFDPDRFADGNTSLDIKGQDFTAIPFGGGRRGCPGLGFAVVAIEHVIAALMYHFDWELPKGSVIDTVSERPGITVQKTSNIFVNAKIRAL